MLCLNQGKFTMLMLGAALVITGVVLKNTYEQMGQRDDPVGKNLGMLSFVAGWVLVAHSISVNNMGEVDYNQRTAIVYACAAGILFSVMKMKEYISNGYNPPMHFPAVFAGAWLLLGYVTGTTATTSLMGVVAAGLVLLSMMVALPWQRKNCVVDGPGMPLFVGGWTLLGLANSLL